MIEVGQKVRYMPHCSSMADKPHPKEVGEKTITGVVVYVSERHHYFCVEHIAKSGVKLWEAFKFCDIGKKVNVCGRC